MSSMKTLTSGISAALILAVCMISQASAADAAKTAKTVQKVHSPESIECSRQADAKGLHGTMRVKFRAECKKSLKAASAKTAKVAPEKKNQAPAKTN